MDHGALVGQVEAQGAAFRDLVDRLDPDAEVPTCPGWTTRVLVEHVVSVSVFIEDCCRAGPAAGPPVAKDPPAGWSAAASWWRDRWPGLVELFRSTPPSAPVWAPPGFAPRSSSWIRRQAHELAIHRLDAEHAAAGPAETVPALFDPQLAVDGVDELLTSLLPPVDVAGTVHYRADDTGDEWWLELTPGRPPSAHRGHGVGRLADASVRGTAEQVYRAVWRRPHLAEVTGTAELVAAVRTP